MTDNSSEPRDAKGEDEDQASLVVRRARTSDVRFIRSLVDTYSTDGRLLSKATVALFEDLPEFLVAEYIYADGSRKSVGCGALHVMWEDLAEVRTIGVNPDYSGLGVGAAILEGLLDYARSVQVERVFVLTFEVSFFKRHGFEVIEGTPVTHEVFDELLLSYDEGVAEFLDLERVKPNTLGNSRMLKVL